MIRPVFSNWKFVSKINLYVLTLCDYFLFDYLRATAFFNRPSAVRKVKVPIEHTVSTIVWTWLRRSVIKLRMRLQDCVWEDDKNLDGIIPKTKLASKWRIFLYIMTNKGSKRIKIYSIIIIQEPSGFNAGLCISSKKRAQLFEQEI
jgi:hypothetical protein